HVGGGLVLEAGEQVVGQLQRGGVGIAQQGVAQHGQIAEDGRQRLVAAQRAQQVAHVEIQRLAVLFGQARTVVPLGQLVQRPEQQGKQCGEDGQVVPVGTAVCGGRVGHGG